MTSLDLSILDFIQAHLQSGFMDWIMPYITTLGNHGYIWIGITILFLCFKKTRKLGLAMAVGLLIQFIVINPIIKPLVERPRPFTINTAHQLLISAPEDFSFPSGHTGAGFAVVSALFFGKNRLWIPALILALLVSFSRMYLYVHYPSDILVGALIGIASGWLACRLILKDDRRLILARR
ncbi:MAG: phosphatase PAP2 family protein [Anaerovoracaceae bacterium]|nr:phosphatase PAP2 family protein [Bacillota bacterium]MDY2671127.1 phosphatase PAP2 family protein [Anaerovoracaceae bacterium]